MKRTILALGIVAAALSGCVSVEQLQAQCSDRATLAGAQPTPEWMGACTRELARQYNERFASEFQQGYAASQAARPRTCTSNRIGTITTTNCY